MIPGIFTAQPLPNGEVAIAWKVGNESVFGISVSPEEALNFAKEITAAVMEASMSEPTPLSDFGLY